MLLQSIAIRFDFRLLRLLLSFLLGTCLIFVNLGCESVNTPSGSTPNSMPSGIISSEELKNMIYRKEIFNLVDVRSYQEYLAGHLPDAVSIPYRQLPYRYRELDFKTKTVVYCRTGQTSFFAAQTLLPLGFTDLYSLAGGYAGWEYVVELSNGSKVI